MDSFDVVAKIIEETILQKGAEHLYNKYLTPKIMPYTVQDTILLAKEQINVGSS